MTRLNIMLLTPGAEPRTLSFNARNNEQTVINDILNAKSGIEGHVMGVDGAWGVLFTCNDSAAAPVNEIGTALMLKHCRGVKAEDVYRGRMILTGTDGSGSVCSLPQSASKTVNTILSASGRRKSDQKPKRAKRPFDVFNIEYQKKRRLEVSALNALKSGAEPLLKLGFSDFNKEVCMAWRAFCVPSQDKDEPTSTFQARVAYYKKNEAQILKDRQPYEDLAREDVKRYEAEMKVFKSMHPSVPSGPSSAYHFFCRSCDTIGKSRTDWKQMTDEEKAPFNEMRHHDMYVRYPEETKVYRDYCTVNNYDYSEMTRKKTGTRKRTTGIAIDLNVEATPAPKKVKTTPKKVPSKKDGGTKPAKKVPSKKGDGTKPAKKVSSKKAQKKDAMNTRFEDSDSE